MGTSFSIPYVRDTVNAVLAIIREIQESVVQENPTFARMRTARESYRPRQGGRTSMAGRQGGRRQGGRRQSGRAPMAERQGTQEEERIYPDAEEEIWIEETVGIQATRENPQHTYSRQTATGANVGCGVGYTRTHLSEEATRRRLYETPGRGAAVVEMKTGKGRDSDTKSPNEGDIPTVGDAIDMTDNVQALEDHCAFQLVSIPSDEEILLAQQKIQYVEGLFHFAVTGVSGAGKSSLINAFRGLRNRDQGATPTGVVETTIDIARFPDPKSQNPFVWYDVPGSGTLNMPDWQYFNMQGLYVFDCIIILFDSRFTMSDLAMLINCRRFNIPTYIVRSKSDSHIRNTMKDLGYSSDDDEGHLDRKALYNTAREQYISETRATVKSNLQEANLPDQRVYIISHITMVSVVREQKLSEKIIDELELMRDLFKEAQLRRCAGSRSPTYEL